MCKVDVTGRNCDRCKDGFYGLHKTNVYGCVGEFDTLCNIYLKFYPVEMTDLSSVNNLCIV